MLPELFKWRTNLPLRKIYIGALRIPFSAGPLFGLTSKHNGVPTVRAKHTPPKQLTVGQLCSLLELFLVSVPACGDLPVTNSVDVFVPKKYNFLA